MTLFGIIIKNDEAFIVIDGRIFAEFEEKKKKLEGEMIVVPKGVKHKPYAKTEAKIMIIEPKGVVNTGEILDKLTAQMMIGFKANYINIIFIIYERYIKELFIKENQ